MYANLKQDIQAKNYRNIIRNLVSQAGETQGQTNVDELVPLLEDHSTPEWVKTFLAVFLATRSTASSQRRAA